MRARNGLRSVLVMGLATLALAALAGPPAALATGMLSEAEACRAAMWIAQHAPAEDPSVALHHGTYTFSPCTNFESISEQGTANIEVPFSSVYTADSITYTKIDKWIYYFMRVDQGWKIGYTVDGPWLKILVNTLNSLPAGGAVTGRPISGDAVSGGGCCQAYYKNGARSDCSNDDSADNCKKKGDKFFPDAKCYVGAGCQP